MKTAFVLKQVFSAELCVWDDSWGSTDEINAMEILYRLYWIYSVGY